MPDSFIEKDFSVRGLRIRIKHWHVDAPHQYIALHGWLDNAASFDVLAPLLPEYSMAAIDLAGQGFSEKRPASATYHLWDDAVDIMQVADQLGWQEFSIMAHSRGAMVATMLAAAFPERIKRLVLLDGLLPWPVLAEESPQQLRQFIQDYSRIRPARIFESREKALAIRARAGGIPLSVVEHFAGRQLRQCHGGDVQPGWYWDADERIKAASAMKMTQAHNQAYLANIECPVLIMLASAGWGGDNNIAVLKQQYPHFLWHILDGHHHLHMDAQAAEVAALCLGAFPC